MTADNDPGIVDFLSIMLELEGYEVCSTLNGVTLLNMNDQLPDLLLLDIWMSGIDGRDICKLLKKGEHTKSLPILMLPARLKQLHSSTRKLLRTKFYYIDLKHIKLWLTRRENQNHLTTSP